MIASFIPLQRENFLATIDGRQTDLYTLTNSDGMAVSFTNYGAKIQQILVPDANGVLGDVALGYESIAQVAGGQPSMGAFIGRYAGRIAGGRFSLDGRNYQLAQNSGPNCLHGGAKGSRLRVFDVRQIDAATAELSLVYADGEEGFPGQLRSRVIYRVTEENELSIEYEAATSEDTVVNFTSHVFFNLAGQGRMRRETLENHVLTIAADAFTPIDADLIPTGEIRPVDGTPMDFRQPTRIGERIDADDGQLQATRGYDHNWVLRKPSQVYAMAAELFDPLSGRRMEVWSTEPGLVFYAGTNLTGEAPRDVGKGGELYDSRAGLCLEPAHFADSPNQPGFPSTRLAPGELYCGKISYRFFAGK